MRLSSIILPLFLLTTLSGQVWSSVLATIGQDNITTDDVNRIRQQLKVSDPAFSASISNDDILDQLIDMKVSVMDAKLAGMDQTREAKETMEAALFNYYRSIKVDDIYKNKKFSKKEILDYYNANPIVKFQRLSIPFEPSDKNDSKRVFAKISVIRSDIEAKKLTFDQAMDKMGTEASSSISGTFDRVPLPSLESSEASELRALSFGEISPVIMGTNFVSIVKLIKIYPLTSENYTPINERLKMEAMIKARAVYFKGLRQKYSNLIIIQK